MEEDKAVEEIVDETATIENEKANTEDKRHEPIGREKKLKAKLCVKTFILDGSEDSDAYLNDFLVTVDNVDRFFNAKEVTKHNDGVLVTFWYLQAIRETESEVTTLGE